MPQRCSNAGFLQESAASIALPSDLPRSAKSARRCPRSWLSWRLLAADLASAGWGLAYVDDLVAHHHPSIVRDVSVRRRPTIRNNLWFAWSRRQLTVALRRTVGLLRSLPRAGLFEALKGLPQVLQKRLVVATSRRAGAASIGEGTILRFSNECGL